MRKKQDRESCIGLLKEKRAELTAAGEKRLPERSDFSAEEIVAVKALLGPWPRALEAAGLKPPRDDARALLEREKRIRAKRRRTEARKSARVGGEQPSAEEQEETKRESAQKLREK